MIGKEIKGYRIDSVLGEGGMATVYSARHEISGHEVAIKVLDSKLAKDDSILTRFRNEATIGKELSHDGIAKVFGFIKIDDNSAFVMEKVNGVPLTKLIESSPDSFPLDRVRVVFRNLLSALSYAHELGIVHRDIKPSNIMIQSNGEPKILDFGIARLNTDTGQSITRTGAQMGSVPYMSPEQIKGQKDVDLRTDIYSLGLVLYEILSGKPAFSAETESELLLPSRIVAEPVPALANLPEDLQWVNDVIQRCTAKDKLDRFGSCEEVLSFMSESASSFSVDHQNAATDTDSKKFGDLADVYDRIKQEEKKGDSKAQSDEEILQRSDGGYSDLLIFLLIVSVAVITLLVFL